MMELWNDGLSELEIGTSVESFQKFLGSQRELLHSQIDQFQEIVVTQCKLTGVNPLSQEMVLPLIELASVIFFFIRTILSSISCLSSFFGQLHNRIIVIISIV
jgi:hypothetical protein